MAAASVLLGKGPGPGSCCYAKVTLPDGSDAVFEAEVTVSEKDYACCEVVKDAGDDPDVTNGMRICAKVSYAEGTPEAVYEQSSEEDIRVLIDGGEGVGRVTKEGLDQPVGAAAINTVPRRMIREAVGSEMDAYGYGGKLSVIISIPGGRERAKKTFNPSLGIEGGLSVLGTTGIVEPMSEQALIDTIGVEISMHMARKEKTLILTPGNYGMDFLRDNYGISPENIIKISNFAGDSIDMAVCAGAKRIVMAGHIGKFIKLAGGIMNTHSHQADARMEILTAYAAVAGAGPDTARKLMGSATVDAGLEILKEEGYFGLTMKLMKESIEKHVRSRAGDGTEVGIIVFSNVFGLLAESENVRELLADET